MFKLQGIEMLREMGLEHTSNYSDGLCCGKNKQSCCKCVFCDDFLHC